MLISNQNCTQDRVCRLRHKVRHIFLINLYINCIKFFSKDLNSAFCFPAAQETEMMLDDDLISSVAFFFFLLKQIPPLGQKRDFSSTLYTNWEESGTFLPHENLMNIRVLMSKHGSVSTFACLKWSTLNVSVSIALNAPSWESLKRF